jgi:hypothetical protein
LSAWNTTVEGNTGCSAIDVLGTTSIVDLSFLDFYNNEVGNFGLGIPSLIGQLVTTNINGDSCDAFFNIFEDPLFVNPSGGDYHLTEDSPCIDAGDPTSPLDPDSTIADIGAFYFDQGASALMAVDPILMIFGPVVSGEQSDLPLTIYSMGGLLLILTDILSSSPDVFYTDFTGTTVIDPGDSLIVTVTFVPQEIQSYEETLSLYSNADPITVTMRGSGISAIQIQLSPYGTPIVIPETGGSFDFNIAVRNLGSETQTFDLWTEVLLPGFGSAELLLVPDLTLQGGQNVDRDREQTVPDFAPGGTYTYIGYVGDHPWVVQDSDAFTFEKEGTEAGRLGTPSDWPCTGDPFDEWFEISEPEIPESFSISAYPNPFNPVTVFSYQLPVASKINLAVYDVAGRQVAELVDGWRDAGYHEISFDAAGLPSGIYVYSLQAAENMATGKMVLMK